MEEKTKVNSFKRIVKRDQSHLSLMAWCVWSSWFIYNTKYGHFI